MDVYEWRSDLFDGDCLLLALSADTNWSKNQEIATAILTSQQVELTLDKLADKHGVDRSDPDEMWDKDFPIWVPVPPIPDTPCRGCLRFFRPTPSEVGDTT